MSFIKKSASGSVVRVPVILQLEALECGAACLAMILACYGKWVPLDKVRTDCGVSRDGSNAKNLLLAARSYGMTAKGIRIEPEALKKNGAFPCIIHWQFNHFVVLCGFRKNAAVINDPARGTVEIPMEEFSQAFTGICLMMTPGEHFTIGGRKKKTAAYIREHLRGAGKHIAVTASLAVLVGLVGIAHTFFAQYFMDNLLGKQQQKAAPLFLLLFLLLAVVTVVARGYQARYSLRLMGRYAVKANAGFMQHILQMPVYFFSQRMSGDILGRKRSNESIAFTLIDTMAPIVIDGALAVVYLAIMLRTSWVLALIGIGGMAVHLLMNRHLSGKRENISRLNLRNEAKLDSATVSGMEMIETIKSSGAESGFFAKWAGCQAAVHNQNLKSRNLENLYTLSMNAVSIAVDMGILFLGLRLIIRGDMTVGMLFAFQGFLMSFMNPVTRIAFSGSALREMRSSMERIEDVMEYPADKMCAQQSASCEAPEKLRGEIELRHVTFGYSPLAKPLIEDLSLTVKPGEKIALVGASGCGKSTVSKLISGLYQPWSGEILLDGKPLTEIDRSVLTGSLAVVDQDITLFEDTIANNIKMWDTTIEDFEMILAARDASMHDVIMQRNEGYRYKMSEGGRDFSGGQRQRLEIARVLAQDPTMIIMDEATSALDAKTEFDVVNAIRDRGITCLVIAHRLSTIRDCDQILVMDHGRIIERGTHGELMAGGGIYQQLIMND
ncbi:MAG: NHLP family bacteriocin export ABC transporter peptidase/permease/ATPase subunit [Clostridia bacterium]|nr:NHLP family bacteriocin export ABC transporter peptidase/permease/ATPase subunit [Clostridia bacterium]